MARRLTILHVEDSDDDVLFFMRALQQVTSTVRVVRVCDGLEAQRYLRGEGLYTDRSQHPLPDAIVLDLRLSGMSGQEFLQWQHNGSSFSHIPCFVLADLETARLDGPEMRRARGQYRKPNDLDDWPQRVRLLLEDIDREVPPPPA